MKKIVFISLLLINLKSVYLLAGDLPEGFVEVKSTSSYKMVLTPYAKYPVPLEEYVLEVVIEGEWGTVIDYKEDPYKFGIYDAGVDEPKIYEPDSLEVDSKGNIYILDFINNRIQKFEKNGRYLKSIPIEGFSGKRKRSKTIVMVDREDHRKKVEPDHPRRIDIEKEFADIEPDFNVVGKNIEINAGDILYYYLTRGGAWETWKFKNDKLVEKVSGKEDIKKIELKFTHKKINNEKVQIWIDLPGEKDFKEVYKSPRRLTAKEEFVVRNPRFMSKYVSLDTYIDTNKYIKLGNGHTIREEIYSYRYLYDYWGTLISIIQRQTGVYYNIVTIDNDFNLYAIPENMDNYSIEKLKRTKILK